MGCCRANAVRTTRTIVALMTRYKQLIKHDPENGYWGDCQRTAIACLLDLEPLDVPHFWGIHMGDDDQAFRDMDYWLENRGLERVQYGLECDSVQAALDVCKNTDEYYMLIGQSKLGTNHVVICRGNKIVHDPSQVDSGIVGPNTVSGIYHYEWLEKIIQNNE